ncbi:hypothetical protein DN752_18230 [Echinicola strongylocentroti]|uniref:DUF4412 domain-containing protein n=1 Tax=Echinicola strongylocentroti TaxID=1795355 RepID=A0A2Z4IMS2_9BACT|nr:DUF4412 domain-containing protein [Echinicola strongylocentroti]AWW31918.1 hypothetical protein DN752_18230 [Echinicola strongylocentroti]
MRTDKLFLAVLSAIFLLPVPSQGQFLKKLKKAAQEGVENAVERRVSNEVENAAQKQTDKYLEQIFGPPSDYEGGDYDYGKVISSIDMNAATEDSYHFTGYTDMEITGTDEKGKDIEPVTFRSFLSGDADFWGIEMENQEKEAEKTVMIFDHKNNASVLLMENEKGEKNYMAYGMDWSKMVESSADKEMEKMDADSVEFDIVKTGNSKTILGYPCEEYRTENDEYAANYWVSTQPIEGYASYWSKNNFLFSKKVQQKYQGYYDQLPDGDILEIHYESKEDESITDMKITEINTKEKFDFEMAEYANAMEGQ